MQSASQSIFPLMKSLAAVALGAAAQGLPVSALAQAYPAKSIRFIIPYPPGGGNDILARDLGANVSRSMNVPMVYDNKPGASTVIGAEAAARAPADGSVIFMGNNSTFSINPNLYRNLPYDPVRDYLPVSLLATIPFVALVHPSVPAHSIQELVALVKASPGKINFGSAGTGIITHLAGEMLNSMAGIRMTHIPYKGSGPVLVDLVAGHIHVGFNNVLSSVPLVRSGKVRALAVTGAKRSEAMPDIPTIAESGWPEYESAAWYAVFVPARTPQEVVRRLNTEFVRAVRDPKVKDRLAADGATLIGSDPETLAKVVVADIPRWGKVIRDANLQLDIPKD